MKVKLFNMFYFSRLYSKLSRNTSRNFSILYCGLHKVMNNPIWSFVCFCILSFTFFGSRNIIDDKVCLVWVGFNYWYSLFRWIFQGESAFNGYTNVFWAEVAKNLKLMTDNSVNLRVDKTL